MLSAQDVADAANAAGIPDTATLANCFIVAGGFAVALAAAAQQTGKSVSELAALFAQRSVLQMQAIALQAQIVVVQRTRDSDIAARNSDIGGLQTQLNAVNAALQATIQD